MWFAQHRDLNRFGVDGVFLHQLAGVSWGLQKMQEPERPLGVGDGSAQGGDGGGDGDGPKLGTSPPPSPSRCGQISLRRQNGRSKFPNEHQTTCQRRTRKTHGEGPCGPGMGVGQ